MLEYFAVKPSERGQGFGTELLRGLRNELIEVHPEKRFSYILAEVPPFVGRDVIRKGFYRKNEALKLQLPNDYKIPKINPIYLQFDELGAKTEQLLLIPVDGHDARPSLPADYVKRIVYGMYHENYGMKH